MNNFTPNFSWHNQDTQLLPAYLWIGNHDELAAHTQTWLQKVLCPHNGCQSCTTCMAIRLQQYHAITWLYPDKQYTLDQLTVINSTLAFTLEPGQKHFFIIQQAQRLTPACSNSLLKSLEEPPAGYHFILLASQVHDILPTIRSRCVVQFFNSGSASVTHQALYDAFTKQAPHPLSFLKIIEQAHITEHDSSDLLDQLLIFWSKKARTTFTAQHASDYKKSVHMVHVLQKALAQPPMPGSSNLLWKNLYLQCESILPPAQL